MAAWITTTLCSCSRLFCQSRCLAVRGIRVNAVAPGVGMQALKRIAQPDDIGGVVAFLASEDARWIIGDTIHVEGGSKL
jgi:3-oxoacyl-[acyl-carrier protein] reductase